MVVGFITTYAISSYHHYGCEFEPRSGEVYSIQHYVIKFASDLRQVGGFLRVLRFPLPCSKTDHDITEILLKVALKHQNPNPNLGQILNNLEEIIKTQL